MHTSWIYMLFNDEFQLSLICVARRKTCFNREWILHSTCCQKAKKKTERQTVPERIRAAGFTDLR